jgi:hypothetical protein
MRQHTPMRTAASRVPRCLPAEQGGAPAGACQDRSSHIPTRSLPPKRRLISGNRLPEEGRGSRGRQLLQVHCPHLLPMRWRGFMHAPCMGRTHELSRGRRRTHPGGPSAAQGACARPRGSTETLSPPLMALASRFRGQCDTHHDIMRRGPSPGGQERQRASSRGRCLIDPGASACDDDSLSTCSSLLLTRQLL